MRRKIVAGNWKMNGTREEALKLTTEIRDMITSEGSGGAEIILAPPFVHIAAVAHIACADGIYVAAQNCSSEAKGAYTGEVSAAMLQSVGATHVIIGHSERRSFFKEDHHMLERKVRMALAHHLIPVFCIGEQLDDREGGRHFSVVQKQLEESLFMLEEADFAKIILAYEPVWAIGTGKTASPEQAQEMHHHIRTFIARRFGNVIADNLSILYGGSCNDGNARDLFALPDVDGGLIGGASLNSRSFVNIVKSF